MGDSDGADDSKSGPGCAGIKGASAAAIPAPAAKGTAAAAEGMVVSHSATANAASTVNGGTGGTAAASAAAEAASAAANTEPG